MIDTQLQRELKRIISDLQGSYGRQLNTAEIDFLCALATAGAIHAGEFYLKHVMEMLRINAPQLYRK